MQSPRIAGLFGAAAGSIVRGAGRDPGNGIGANRPLRAVYRLSGG